MLIALGDAGPVHPFLFKHMPLYSALRCPARALCMLVMRVRAPAIARPFRTPLVWLVGPGAVLGCLYLFASLPAKTIEWCLLWNAIGLAIYAIYGRHRSLLGQAQVRR